MRRGRRGRMGVLVLACALGLMPGCGGKKHAAAPPAPRVVPRADGLAVALAFAPAAAPVLGAVETNPEGGPLAGLLALTRRLPANSVVAGVSVGKLEELVGLGPGAAVPALLGDPIVVWAQGLDGRGLGAAWVTTDGTMLASLLADRVRAGTIRLDEPDHGSATYALPGGRALARRGATLLYASDRATLDAALIRQAVHGGATLADFRGAAPSPATGPSTAGGANTGRPTPGVAAAGGAAANGTTRGVAGPTAAVGATAAPAVGPLRAPTLPAGALATFHVSGQELARLALARAHIPADGLAGVPYLAALGPATLGLYAERDGLRLRARIATDAALAPGELPVATGAAPPAPRGAANDTLVVGLRDPAQSIAWLRAALRILEPDRLKGLDNAQTVLGRYAGIDLGNDLFGQLTRTATVTTADFRALTVLADPGDPGKVRSVLDRIGDVSRLAGGIAGLVGVNLGGFSVDAQGDGTKVVRQNGTEVVRVAVKDDELVASTLPGTDLAAVQAAASPPLTGVPALGALRASYGAAAFKRLLIGRLGIPTLAQGLLAPLGAPVLTARTDPTTTELELLLPIG